MPRRRLHRVVVRPPMAAFCHFARTLYKHKQRKTVHLHNTPLVQHVPSCGQQGPKKQSLLAYLTFLFPPLKAPEKIPLSRHCKHGTGVADLRCCHPLGATPLFCTPPPVDGSSTRDCGMTASIKRGGEKEFLSKNGYCVFRTSFKRGDGKGAVESGSMA
ncbi:hypothetical protein JTE90_005651 [Oedothorax gibbosus]|uniref:Uncharacterized protein n=1 Tax=Oedothorax gibbosus TaxID=931172 RepID=A0AAV6UHZ0_9ARAC|nr:hypothetical protein JTE90_005651 [Oedothorax gibbosus]